MKKHFLSGYFSFTKKERTGIIVLLSLILFFVLLPFCFPLFTKHQEYDHSQLEKEIVHKQLNDSSTQENNYVYKNYKESFPKKYTNVSIGELFYFDPNTLSKTGWEKLGLRDKTIATIQNYLSKGGRFYKPEDIKKNLGPA